MLMQHTLEKKHLNVEASMDAARMDMPAHNLFDTTQVQHVWGMGHSTCR